MTTYADPGAIADVVALVGRVEATWGNAMRDRVVQRFVDTTTRDAAIPSPHVGQLCVITGGAFSYVSATPGAGTLLEYQSATTGWTKPWNMPWGPVAAVANAVATQGTITAVVDLTSLSIAFTAVANRRYRVTLGLQVQSTVALDTVSVTITDAANTILQTKIVPLANVNQQFPVHVQLDTSVPAAAGAYTFKGRILRNTGTGTVSTATAGATQPNQLSVEDIGPSANAA